jgi:retron-type reverse transcriptase
LRNILEKSFAVNKKLYIAFVDLLKVFDNLNWNVMMKILKMIIIDYRDRKIISVLYKHQTTSIKIIESKREATIRKGVRQGCKLSPLLFNIYIEQVINECKEYCSGIKVNAMRIQMLRFANYIAIMAQDEINLNRAYESLVDSLKSNYKIKINRKKQKFWFPPKILKILILKKGMTTSQRKYRKSGT